MHSFNKGFSPYYILAWLNSRLFQYIFECFFDGLKMAGGYLPYSAPYLSSMYIRDASASEQKRIISEVAQILKIKKQNPNADTTALEAEIDLMVYDLYGLNEKEIQIVEENSK